LLAHCYQPFINSAPFILATPTTTLSRNFHSTTSLNSRRDELMAENQSIQDEMDAHDRSTDHLYVNDSRIHDLPASEAKNTALAHNDALIYQGAEDRVEIEDRLDVNVAALEALDAAEAAEVSNATNGLGPNDNSDDAS